MIWRVEARLGNGWIAELIEAANAHLALEKFDSEHGKQYDNEYTITIDPIGVVRR